MVDGDEERDEREAAVDSVARLGMGGRLTNWREAVRVLAGEPLPPKLRTALVELGAQGHRVEVAVAAYRTRLLVAMVDAEEREAPVLACRGWAEYGEREEALAAYGEVRRAVAVMAQAWVEGKSLSSPGGSGS